MKRKLFIFFFTFSSLTPLASLHAEDTSWKFALGLSYKSNSIGEFNTINYQGRQGQIEIENSWAVDFEAQYMPKNSWGGTGGLSLGKKSNIGMYWDTHSTAWNSSELHSINIHSLYGNAVYRWNNLYIPFGLHYSLISLNYRGTNTEDRNDETKHTLGGQLGAGLFLPGQWSIEFLLRTVRSSMRFPFAGQRNDLYPKGGSLSSSILSVKYIF